MVSTFRQVRVPLGVVAVIYESRPNVTVDAGVLGFKAGNAVVLRGGREALSTNAVLAELIVKSLAKADLDPHAVTFIANPDREVIRILKRMPAAIDLIIPRGGNALKTALAGSAVPVLPHFDGICHTYVDRAADLQMAEDICFNAKCSRPSVCNAMETMIVHAEIAPKFLPRIAARMRAAAVELRGDDRTRAIVADAGAATDEDWDTEYLDLILAIKVVDSLEDAIAFIARHGSGFADAIVTQDEAVARPLRTRSRFGHGLCQRFDALHRRLRIRLWRGNRHLDQSPARARSDGTEGIDHLQIPDSRAAASSFRT